MSRWSVQAVEKAAPDASSLTAARKLAIPGPWSATGSTDALLWGQCQGSGKTPYQVSVDLTGPAYRCSCPSRKFPCKHALALLLLWARGDDAVEGGATDEPGFAQQWAQRRAERAAAGTATSTPSEPAPGPVDEAARARRTAQRLALMDSGIEEFALWLTDLVRGGTAAARRRPRTWWDTAGARLVDAQLPGLAEQVRETGKTLAERDDWAEHLLAELGQWWTIVQAWRQRESLDRQTAADLRAVVGWAMPSDEVRGVDDVTGRWQVLGAHRDDAGRLQQQRTWLRDLESGEVVVVLDFAARAQPLPAARLVGSVIEATVGRHPGSSPRRALLGDEAVAVAAEAPLPPGTDLDGASRLLSSAWSANPWVRRVPVVLDDVILSMRDRTVGYRSGDRVALLDTEDAWTTAARTGGHPCRVFGELEGEGFRPLTVEPASAALTLQVTSGVTSGDASEVQRG